jgi:FkbM family methyltransferase
MLAPMGSAQSWSAAFTGSYDDEVIELLRSYVAEGDLIVDVGACLGFYTVPLAMAAQAGRGHVLAVEPVAANRAILEANLALNQVTDVVSIVPCGLGRVTTEVTVHIESLGSGNATIVSGLDPSEIARHDRDGWTGATETVRLHRLDDLDLSPGVRARRCCLMKIDVEGFEEDVLAGASAFVAAHRPAILAEFNPDWLETRGSAQSLPVEWAEANDYDCWELVHLRRRPWSESKKISLRPLVPGTARTGSDLLFLPRT